MPIYLECRSLRVMPNTFNKQTTSKIITLVKTVFLRSKAKCPWKYLWEAKTPDSHWQYYHFDCTSQIFKILMPGPHSRSVKIRIRISRGGAQTSAFFESSHCWEPLIYMKTVFPNCRPCMSWKKTCIFMAIVIVKLISKKWEQMIYS